MAFAIGAPGGALAALLLIAYGASSVARTLVAVPFGVVFVGLPIAFLARRRWPRAQHLDPADRIAVIHAVRGGTPVQSKRQALAVVDYAAVVRRDVERGARQTWILGVFLVLSVGLLLVELVQRSLRGAIVMAALSLWWVLAVRSYPKHLRRQGRNTERAMRSARELLASLPPDDSRP